MDGALLRGLCPVSLPRDPTEKHMWCPKCRYITSSPEMTAKTTGDLPGGCWLLRRLLQLQLGCWAWDVIERSSPASHPRASMRWMWWGQLHSGTLAVFTGASNFHLGVWRTKLMRHFGQTILTLLKWRAVDFRQPWKLGGTFICTAGMWYESSESQKFVVCQIVFSFSVVFLVDFKNVGCFEFHRLVTILEGRALRHRRRLPSAPL